MGRRVLGRRGWQGLIREGFVEELDVRWVLKGGGCIPDIAVERNAARSPAPWEGQAGGRPLLELSL